MDYKVFSIIVTYNGMKWIKKCLQSLISSVFPTKIIIIDNGSTDGTIEFIKTDYPEIHLICSTSNLGFGKANNIGMKQALSSGADLVFLLNQDAWIEPDAIGSMVETFNENPQLGIVSPVHLNGKGTSLDHYFRDYILASEINDLADSFILQKKFTQTVIRTSYVNAAAWLLSRACIEKTGGFDPIFFHYGEDENYAQRIAFKGFSMCINLKAKIYHDRETRIAKVLETQLIDKKKEWNLFLIQVCDPSNLGYRKTWLKKCVRHLIMGCSNLVSFNVKDANDHFSVLYHTITSYSQIKFSRKRALNGDYIV